MIVDFRLSIQTLSWGRNFQQHGDLIANIQNEVYDKTKAPLADAAEAVDDRDNYLNSNCNVTTAFDAGTTVIESR